MNKAISFFLILTFLFSLVSGITVFSLNQELIYNYGFEDGTADGYSVGNTVYEVDSAYAKSGDYGIKISNRSTYHTSCAQDVTQIVQENGAGFYKISLWVRLADSEQPSVTCFAVLRTGVVGSTNKKYSTSGQKNLTTTYQQFIIDAVFSEEEIATLGEIRIYPQTDSKSEVHPDICIDDISLIKTGNLTAVEKDETDISSLKRSSVTTVGAIRWDAWYTHDGRNGSVVTAVEKSLSPGEYHYRAPFFATITSDHKIIIPEYTQAIFDREMEYAKYAGIDYFAYVWYDGAMASARKFHTQSKYRNSVKMCALMDSNGTNKSYARQEMRTLLKQSYYMTVLDGRPLMYYLYSGTNLSAIHEDIVYYKNLCKELGIKQPYAVIMGGSASKTKEISADAMSDYAIKGSLLSFDELAEEAVSTWEGDNDTGVQYVPCVTAGWSPEPRYYNPPFWTTANGGVANDSWCEDASSKQIFDHLSYALSYMQHNEVKANTMANTVIMYAWNEHDEGGWICPTLKVDECGNQLYNKDGTKKFDETRINAVKQAISFYKSGKRVKVYVNGVSNGYTATKASSLVNVTSALQTKVYEGVKWASDLIIDNPSFEPEMETDPLEELLTDNSLSPSIEASTTIVPEAPDSSASIDATITSPPNETPAFSEVAPKIPAQKSNLWVYFIVGGVALITCGAVLTVIIIKKKSKN